MWLGTLVFSALAIARAVDAGISHYVANSKEKQKRRLLYVVPRLQQCWWHLAKQRDDSYVSQISLDIEVANLSDHPVQLIKAHVIRPRTRDDAVHTVLLLPKIGSPYHSEKHPVPARNTATASVHFMVRGQIAPQGKPLRLTVGITDQFGEEYTLKGLVIPTRDRRPPTLPWKSQVSAFVQKFRRSSQKQSPPSLPLEWQHQGRFEDIDLILIEERRNYAAHGRERGGLGSLNVTLQSEPKFGWTKEGEVPSLLWPSDIAKRIGSQNTERLIALHAARDNEAKAELERYLLSHLHRSSPFADVAYLVFLALHRMGRTVDAIQAARASLAGDKVFGYSNTLGTLSAIVSHEHFAINPRLYPQILDALSGDTEHDFRLREKINLARVQHLDRTINREHGSGGAEQ